MPQDRLLHPKASRSQKVTSLTDFEYRVWTQYMLSADDFGVMRHSGVTLQADNDALNAKPKKIVQRALDHLVSIGLIAIFEHQGRRYTYQRDWQDWQKVEYPRATIEPKPSIEVLVECSPLTRELFAKHPGGNGKKKSKDSPNVPQTFSERSPNDLETSESLAGARARETANANGLRQTQERESEGKRSTLIVTDEIAERAAALLNTYDRLYTLHRHGAKHFRRAPAIHHEQACHLVQTWPDDRLVKMIEILLTTDDEWVQRTDRGWGVFVSRATWCDERLSEWEAKQKNRRPA